MHRKTALFHSRLMSDTRGIFKWNKRPTWRRPRAKEDLNPDEREELQLQFWHFALKKSKTNGQEVTQKARTDKLSLGRFKTKRTGHPLRERRGRTRQRQGRREWERGIVLTGAIGCTLNSVIFNVSYFFNSQLLGSANYCARLVKFMVNACAHLVIV
jgi:hypothetical protein